MDNLLNSSGRFSQDSVHWESSIRFNRWWENYSVNQRTSQAGSSSRQCLTTLSGMQMCSQIPSRSLVFLRAWIWKEVVRNLRSQTRWILGIEGQRKCCWISQDPVVRCCVVPVPWREENQKAVEVERSQYTSMAAPKTSSCFSKWSSPSFSSVSSEQLIRLVRELWGNPKHQVNWTKWRFLHNLFLQKCKPMKSDRGTCCKKTSNDLKNCQKTRSSPDYAPKQVWD